MYKWLESDLNSTKTLGSRVADASPRLSEATWMQKLHHSVPIFWQWLTACLFGQSPFLPTWTVHR